MAEAMMIPEAKLREIVEHAVAKRVQALREAVSDELLAEAERLTATHNTPFVQGIRYAAVHIVAGDQ